MDSLGLGLTLDTILLEKADKTLENMQKNSKLIMQNLTRGFTAFNEGKIGNFTQVFDDVSKAMDRLSKAKVSPDFDTKGQEKYIDRMEHLLTIVEKMSKIDVAKFFDPKEVYATDKRPDEIFAEMGKLKEYKEELKGLIEVVNNYGEAQKSLSEQARKQEADISKQKNEVEKLAKTYEEAEAKFNSSMDALSKFRDDFFDSKRKKKPSLTDEEIQEMYSSSKSKTKTTLLKQLEEERVAINEAKKALDNAYKDLSKKREALSKTTTEYKENKEAKKNIENIKLAYDNIKEREKILQKELEFSQATEAERAAMLTRRNEAEIKADQKRIRDVQKSYETLRKEIQKGEKDIADLEASRASLSKAGKDTTSVDKQLGDLYARLDKQMDLEEEFVKSNYPHIAELREKYETEAFVKAQKERAKKAQEEQKKDISYANQFSRNAKSVEEEKQAIELLRSARNNLSQDTAHYSRIVEALNKRILTHKDHIESVTREEKEQNTLSDSVINRYRKQLKALDDVNEALEKQMKIERKTSVADLDPTNADTQSLLARQKTIAEDIKAIEKSAQGELDVIREQHEAERAKKRIDETLRQNEREKQEYAKLLDEKYALEKQKNAIEDAGAGVGDKAYDSILEQELYLINRISQLRAKHQNDLDEIDKKHNKKRNDDDVKAFIEAQKEKQKIAEETQKKIDEYNKKYGTTSKKNAEMAINSYSGAQNINQHKQAIEGLQQVRARLDNTDKDYYETLKKLNREIYSHELFIRAAENESVRLGNSHRGLMDISGQLMRRLALVFSVSQMTQYFRKLIEVRGQFEKTEVALTSIIQSQEKAKKLMNQTIALAIKSPFTLQQLTGYTKQLAAYQVEYKDLYNTTKLLADVSAGLGVEMDRLILAFGQVKAANYLRATEVRQFTEAGFNILGELAKYYSELEGTVVSVGDVQERVTKRMVDFADVEEIFHRVTEAGGMFYEMQSKQAETLAGQWTNLQDRIDVMFNEIGTSHDGLLKFIVKMLASAIDNWEVLASSIKTAATAFIIFKTYSLLAGDGMKLLAIQMGVLTDTVPKVLSLGQAFKTLGRVVSSAVTKIGASMGTLLTNPLFLAVAAIGALVSAGVSLYRHFDKMKDALKEQSDSFNEYTSSLSKLSREFSKLDTFTEKLAKLEELKSKLNERGLALSVEIDEVSSENIDKIFAEHSEILQKSYDLGLSIGNAITKGLNAAQGNIFGWSLFGENLAEDAEDFAEKWNKLASYGMDAQMTSMTNEIEATIAAMNDMTEEERSAYAEMLKIYETIKDGRKEERDDKGKIIKYTESEYEWTIRRATALKQIQDLEDGSVTKNNKLARYLSQVARQERELNHEVENTVNKLAKEFGGLEKLMQAAKDNPVEFSAAIQAEIDKQAWDDVTKWVYSQKLHARLDIEPNYVEDPSRTDSEKLAQFQQDLMSARTNLKGVKDGYQNFFISEEEIKNMKFFSDGLEGIQKLYDENKKTIEQLEGTKGAYNKEEMARLNALQKELRAVAKLWGYDIDIKGKGGESEALKNLKDQIKLIRDANKAYEERNKKFGKEASKSVVTDSYKDAFKEVELAIEDIDYTNLEGVVKALKTLEDEAKRAGGTAELLKAISEVKAEIGLTLKEKQDRELFDQVQDIFDKYELAVDIKKLKIPTELAKNLFGVDTKSLDQMRNEIISKFASANAEVSKILSKGSVISAEDEQKLIDLIGKERVNEAKKAIEKIDDLEEKQQKESAKRLVEFLAKNLDQTKVVLAQKGIDISYAKSQFDKGAISAQNFAEVVREITKQANEDISKINFKKFKDSSLYIKAMGDLAAYSKKELDKMTKALSKVLAENAKNMSVEELEAYHKALERIRKEQEKFDPFIRDNEIAKIKELIRLQTELANEEKNRKNLENEKASLEQQRISLLQLLEGLQSQGNAGQSQWTKIFQDKLLKTEEGIQQVDSLLANSEMNISNIAGQIGNITGGAMGVIAMIDMIVQAVNDTCNAAKKTFEDIMSMADSFGVETDKGSWREASMFFEGMSNFNAEVTEGWENLKSGNAIGTVANTIGSIVGFIRDVNKWIDSNLEEALQEHLEEVERLEKEYERLERAIDKAFAFERYSKVSEQTSNLAEQAQNINKAIALEEDKKDTDPERIKELKGQVEDINNQIEDLFDNLKQELIGSFEDMGDSLANAMIEAFKAGEDGLEAWNKEVDSIIAGLVKKLTVQKYLEPQISAAIDALFSKMMPKTAAAEKAAERYGATSDEAVAAYKEAEGELPRLDKNSAEEFKRNLELIGLSYEEIAKIIAGITGGEAGGLSSLQKGISGITEQQAEILTAYWNSVRGYTASIDSKMDLILANMGVGSENNPMLEQLRSQTGYLKTIKDVLSGASSFEARAIWVKLAGQK